MVGRFTNFQGKAKGHIAKINPDGDLDSTFTTSANDDIYTCKVLSTGKILIGGRFTTLTDLNGTYNRGHFARLNKDGTVDTTFAAGAGFDDEVFDIEIQSTGNIVVGGRFHDHDAQKRKNIARVLKLDGSPDNTFNPGSGFNDDICDIEVGTGDDLIVGGRFDTANGVPRKYIERLHVDGDHDNTFTNSGFDKEVYCVHKDHNDDIVVGGRFSTCEGASSNHIAKLNGSDGKKSTTFNPGIGFDNDVNELDIDDLNNIFAGGKFNTYNGVVQKNAVKINPLGVRDATYVTNITNEVNAVSVQADGRVFYGGSFTNAPGPLIPSKLATTTTQNYFTKVYSWGAPVVPKFFNGGINQWIFSIKVQPDGKVLVSSSGQFIYDGVPLNTSIIRLNSNGTLDQAFVNNLTSLGVTSLLVSKFLIQSDNKIILVSSGLTINGAPMNSALNRLNTDGTLDAAYAAAQPQGATNAVGLCYDGVLQPDGKLILAYKGSFPAASMYRVSRFLTTGAIDPSFTTLGAESTISTVGLQTTGQVIIGGSYTTVNGAPTVTPARFTSTGVYDPTFNLGNTTIGNNKYQFIVEPITNNLFFGDINNFFGIASPFWFHKFNPTGGLINAFVAPNTVTFNPSTQTANNIALQADGKIIYGGYYPTPTRAFLRLNTDGSLDTTMRINYTTGNTTDIEDDPTTQKIYIGRTGGTINGVAPGTIIRLLPNGESDAY